MAAERRVVVATSRAGPCPDGAPRPRGPIGMIQAIDIGLIQNLDGGAQKASRIDLPVSAGVQARSQAGCSHGADGEPRDRRFRHQVGQSAAL